MMRLVWARRKYIAENAIGLGPQEVLMSELGIARPDYQELESAIRQVILNDNIFCLSRSMKHDLEHRQVIFH